MIYDIDITKIEKDTSKLQRDFELDYIMINKSPVSGSPYIHIRFYNKDTDTKCQRDYSYINNPFLNDVSLGEIIDALYKRFENDLFAFEEIDYIIDETIWNLVGSKNNKN